MKLEFTNEEIVNKINVVEIEDIIIFGEYIEVQDEYYVLVGKAQIEGETFNGFEVEFTLTEEPSEKTCTCILDTDWNEYDFIF